MRARTQAESPVDRTGANVAREPCGRRPIARREGPARPTRWRVAAAMTDRRTSAEPAGGTTTRSSAGRAGRFIRMERHGGPGEDTERTVGTAGETAAGEGVPAGRGRARHLPAWLDADVFAPDGKGSRADWSKQPFTIIQPPPNVTGSLHLGHAQRSTVEDLMIRHARMQRRPALFLPGSGPRLHRGPVRAGQDPGQEGQTRASLGREKYLEAMWEFVHETRKTILGQQRRVGASLDMGAGCVSPWTTSRPEGGPRGLPAPVPRGFGLPDRGADPLVPRLPDQRARTWR